MAENVLTEWEQNFCAVIRARQPGIVVQTLEEHRARKSMARVAQWMAMKKLGARKLRVWSHVGYTLINPMEPKTGQTDHVPIEELPFKDFFQTVSDFQDPDGDSPVQEILVLCDCAPELEKATHLRLLREALWEIRGTQRTIVLIGRAFDIPDELAADLTIMPFDLPNLKELDAVISPHVGAYKAEPKFSGRTIDLAQVPLFVRACAGLTENEAKGLTGLAVARYGAFDSRAVEMALREKAALVRRSNVLEYKTCRGQLTDVGGLEYAKHWIMEQDNILRNADLARSFGCKLPKGLFLLGLPGSGKSLLAQTLAAHWQVPLLYFDVGRAFGSLLGQTEQAVQQVINMANAIQNCILYFDEMEKTLGGGSGELDGGTGSRVRAKLLNWLQEKPEGVFVVATANDISKFEKSPELIRSGRFDKIFFCDLPDLRARLEILAIHYRKAVKYAQDSGYCSLATQIPPDTLISAAREARGFSGAELEVVMQTALRFAFNSDQRPNSPTSEMFVAAVRSQTPLSVTMREPIAALRAWVKAGRAQPAGATIEDDQTGDERTLSQYGLPDILEGQA